MAVLESDGFDEVVKQMEDLGLIWDDGTIDSALKEGGDISKQEWITQIQMRTDQHTGQLASSIKRGTPVKKNGSASITISPKGTREKGKRNAMVAFVLNYSSRYPRQNGFVEAADTSAEPKVTAKFQEIIDKKIQKIGE